MSRIGKRERYWNIGFGLIATFVIGYVFDFEYFSRITPPLEYFTIITNPFTAIFYLGCFLIAFRHSYMLMVFVADRAPKFQIPFALIFGITIIFNVILIYLSFGMGYSSLTYPFEWYIMVSLEFIALFWQLMIVFKLLNKRLSK